MSELRINALLWVPVKVRQSETIAIEGFDTEVRGEGAYSRATGFCSPHDHRNKPQAMLLAFGQRIRINDAISRTIRKTVCRIALLEKTHVAHAGKGRATHLQGNRRPRLNSTSHKGEPGFRNKLRLGTRALPLLLYCRKEAGRKFCSSTVGPTNNLKSHFLQHGLCRV
jgi:hypothetical protein